MYPILFKIGPFTVYSFGTLLALGALAAGWVVKSELNRYRYNTEIASTIVEGIFSEANRTLIRYERENNKSIGQVVITGGGSILNGLLEVAEKNIDAEVRVSDPFSNLQ